MAVPRQLTAYVRSIGMNDPLVRRVSQIYREYGQLIEETIRDWFVSEYVNEDGSRTYESLWFFSENHVMEAKGFVSTDNFDSMQGDTVVYWQITKQDYDLVSSREKSRLSVQFRASNSISGELRASGENCHQLRDVFRRHIVRRDTEAAVSGRKRARTKVSG